MSDDERKRRRLGDETKARIADLASGWDIPSAPGGAPDASAKPGAPASAPRRAPPPKTQPPPPPSAPRRGLDDVLLDMSEDLDSAELLEPDESGVGAASAGDAKRGGDARQPSSTRRGPTESSVVDVSGLISDQTPSPEPIVPAPTVDASALGGTVLTSEPVASPAGASERSGGLGAAKGAAKDSLPGGAKGPGRAVPPPTRSGTRTNPPPPPTGARATSLDATLPAGASATARTGASGSLPASPAAGAGPRKAAAPASSADADSSDSRPLFPGLTSGATAGARTPVSSADADSSDSDLIFDDLALASDAPVKQRGLTAAIAEVEDEDDDDDASFDDLASPPAAGAARGMPPRSTTSGLSPAGTARGAGSSISGRLPLPADPGEPAAARPRTALAPRAVTPRPGRAVPYGDESGTETVPEASPSRTRPNPPLAVPVGEFDASRAQPTVQRDPSSELLTRAERSAPKSPKPPSRVASSGVLLVEAGAEDARDDATTIDPRSQREGRGDPTSGADPTGILVSGASGARAPKARLRTVAQLHRTRGVGGDMRYVLTVIFGLRRARREISALEAQEATLQQSRRRHLITLGRTAITAEGFDHLALGRARAQLAEIEDDRTRNIAAVANADSELQRVNKDREATARQHATEIEEIDAELAELQKQLQPLEKELGGVTRRAAALRDSVRRLDEKLAFTEARLAGADLQEAERGAIQAEIASLKADRKAIQKDEPVLASSLDSLQPRIAKLEAARADARRRRADIEQEDRDDQRRTEDLLAAVGAKRKVLDRAASDAEAQRDKIAFELGERIYVDRPESMGPELAPLDAIDVELGTVDRRTMEMREILQSVDRWKLVRSIGLWLLVFAAIGFGVYGALALGLI